MPSPLLEAALRPAHGPLMGADITTVVANIGRIECRSSQLLRACNDFL